MKLNKTQKDHSMILHFLIIIKTFHLDFAGDYFRVPHRLKTGPSTRGKSPPLHRDRMQNTNSAYKKRNHQRLFSRCSANTGCA